METKTLAEDVLQQTLHIGIYCNVCKHPIFNFDIFFVHVLENHFKIRNGIYRCLTCKKKSKRMIIAIKHIMYHNNLMQEFLTNNNTCSVCSKKFSSKWSAEYHILSVHLKLNKWVRLFLQI